MRKSGYGIYTFIQPVLSELQLRSQSYAVTGPRLVHSCDELRDLQLWFPDLVQSLLSPIWLLEVASRHGWQQALSLGQLPVVIQ